MVKINNGDVPNLDGIISNATPTNSIIPVSLALQETDLINTMKSAMLIRGDIRCRLSQQYKCGYEIRPIIWFVRRTDEIDKTLEKIGLSWRKVFVKTEDITKLCHCFELFFSLSTKQKELEMVRYFNGILPQPNDYEEVLEVIGQIMQYHEAL